MSSWDSMLRLPIPKTTTHQQVVNETSKKGCHAVQQFESGYPGREPTELCGWQSIVWSAAAAGTVLIAVLLWSYRNPASELPAGLTTEAPFCFPLLS